MDLSGMVLGDLRTLQEQVAREIKQRGEQEIAKAREQIMAIAKSVGVPLQELLGQQRVKGGPVPPRYRNPADPDQQWSGRGRQPQWVKDLIAAGNDLESARI